MKSREDRAVEDRLKAFSDALEAVRTIVWTPQTTLPKVRREVARVLQKLDAD